VGVYSDDCQPHHLTASPSATRWRCPIFKNPCEKSQGFFVLGGHFGRHHSLVTVFGDTQARWPISLGDRAKGFPFIF
jgi:hypothetical protein